MNKVLTSPSSIGQISPKPFEILKENGYEVINNPYGRKLTEDEVIEIAKDCVGIVAGVEPLNSKVMDSLPNLKCISRVGVGMDSVDLEYAASKGITVVNTPNGPTRAVAELSLGLTMSLLRMIPQAHHDMRQRKWVKRTGNLLQDKVIGIVGLGNIGRSVANLFLSLGNKVIGYDLYPNRQWAEETGVEIMGLEAVFSNADIISLHIPGNSDKSPVIGEEELSKLGVDTYLVNLSRGGVVDEKALFHLLNSKKIAGAAIDVFSEEPYSGEFCDLENVVLTPHLGSYAKEGKLNMEVDAVNNLINVLKSE